MVSGNWQSICYNTPMSRRLQFSLKGLFGAALMVGMLCGSLAPRTSPLAGALTFVILVLLPGLIANGAISNSRTTRLFCIGAFFPSILGLWVAARLFRDVHQYLYGKARIIDTSIFLFGDFAIEQQTPAAIIFILVPLAGAASLGVGWLFRQSKGL